MIYITDDNRTLVVPKTVEADGNLVLQLKNSMSAFSRSFTVADTSENPWLYQIELTSEQAGSLPNGEYTFTLLAGNSVVGYGLMRKVKRFDADNVYSNVQPDTVYGDNTDYTYYTVSISASLGGYLIVNGQVYQTYSESVREGRILTVQAVPGEHYTFDTWSDGVQDAERVITVTEDITLTATYEAMEYTVSISADSNGSVSVDGTPGDYSQSVAYGTVLTLEADGDTGYGFTGWSDGNTDNPRELVVNGDITLTAAFAIGMYQVTITAGQNGTVSVNGVVGDYSQTVAYGTQLVIEGTPDTGYEFVNWSDGRVTNPRTITVTGPVSLTSTYRAETYAVTINSEDTTEGNVSVNGVVGDYTQNVAYGTQLTLTVAPSQHYSFVMWSDGIISSTRTVTVTGPLTLTAVFAIDTYNVSITSGSNGSVSVNGVTGDYTQVLPYGTVLAIEADPNTGYNFTQWSDGGTTASRSVTVTGDLTLSASFAIQTFSVSISAGQDGSVSVNGTPGDYSATVNYGTVLTATATADQDYNFTQWSDGDTSNPRTVTVTGDLNLTASFAIDTYIVNVSAGANGSVSVNGTVGNYSQLVAYGTQLEISAIPAMGYNFTAWSDGVSSAARTITVTGDVTLSAAFEIQTFTVSISAGSNGSVSVNGTPGDYLQTVNYGTALVLEATPSTGYDFTQWSDGNGNSQRIIAVTGDVTLSAAFAIQTFSVSISAGSNGSVSVNGTPGDYSATVSYGTVLTIEGTGDTGYNFDQWSDGDTSNPRTITVTSNVTLSAAFEEAVPVQPDDEIWYTTSDSNTLYTPGDYNFSPATVVSNTYSDGKGIIKFSQALTKVGGFSYSGRLLTISLPSTVTTINDNAFYSDNNLTSITLPSSLTTIGNGAFGQTGLTSINIPASVSSINDNAFSTSTLASVTVDPANTVYDSRGNCNGIIETSTNKLITGCKNAVIPNTVTSIGDGAFGSCSGLTSLTIPNSVTSIGQYAFSGCTGLTSVTIGSGVTSIGQYAFSGCTGLTSVTIGSGVTSIGQNAFSGCTGLTSVTIPNSLSIIDEYVFNYCTALASVIIGSNVTDIYNQAFRNCSSLASITFADTTSVPTVQSYAFYNVSSTGTVYGQPGLDYSTVMSTLPSGWTLVQPQPTDEIWYTSTDSQVVTPSDSNGFGGATITSNTYSGGKGVIKFSQAVTAIGDDWDMAFPFNGCTTLASVSIPSTVTSILGDSFAGCSSLAHITVDSSNTVYSDYGLDGVYQTVNGEVVLVVGTNNTVMKDDLVEIAASAFNGRTLDTVYIPNSVTRLGYGAFQQSTVTTVVIGTSFSGWLPDALFYNCSSLNAVYCLGTNEIKAMPSTFMNVAFYGTWYGQSGVDYSVTMGRLPGGWSLVTNWSAISYTSSDTNKVEPLSTAFKDYNMTTLSIGFNVCDSGGNGAIGLTGRLDTIASGAFTDTNLAIVEIPSSVTSVNNTAFNGTPLSSIKVKDGPDGSTVSGNNKLYSKYDGSEKHGLFKSGGVGSTRTDTLVVGAVRTSVPDTVTVVGQRAYKGNTLLSQVLIGNCVTAINDEAFTDCSNLWKITLRQYLPAASLGSDIFDGVRSSGTLYGRTGVDYTPIMSRLPSGWTLTQN